MHHSFRPMHHSFQSMHHRFQLLVLLRLQLLSYGSLDGVWRLANAKQQANCPVGRSSSTKKTYPFLLPYSLTPSRLQSLSIFGGWVLMTRLYDWNIWLVSEVTVMVGWNLPLPSCILPVMSGVSCRYQWQREKIDVGSQNCFWKLPDDWMSWNAGQLTRFPAQIYGEYMMITYMSSNSSSIFLSCNQIQLQPNLTGTVVISRILFRKSNLKKKSFSMQPSMSTWILC